MPHRGVITDILFDKDREQRHCLIESDLPVMVN